MTCLQERSLVRNREPDVLRYSPRSAIRPVARHGALLRKQVQYNR